MLNIAISAYSTCIQRPRCGGFRWNITVTFGAEKLERCDYRMWKKLKIPGMFIPFDRMHERELTSAQLDFRYVFIIRARDV